MPQDDIKQMHLLLAERDFAVLCFFNCPYVARSANPQAAHELMERHYKEKHSHQIDRMVARLKD